MNEILLRRKHMVVIPINSDDEYSLDCEREIIALMKNVESLGFTFSQELYKALHFISSQQLEQFGFELVENLKKHVGADKQYNPMYPNFPVQVEEMSNVALFTNSILHYWSYGRWIPGYEKDSRLPLIDSPELTVITIGTDDDLMQIFTNLTESKTSLSTQDKEDIEWFIANKPDYQKYLPDEIPLKENCALIGKLIIEKSPIKSASIIDQYFKTATDVLRLITCMSDGDISLAQNCKFRNLKRPERRMIMDLLINCGDILDDMYRYKNRWIRIGEIIHPNEFSDSKYENVIAAFYTLRNEHKPLMFAGKVQQAILNNDTMTAVSLLAKRPGDFARQLDKLIRMSDEKTQIKVVNSFGTVSENVSTPVLLQVMQHFNDRNNCNGYRVFFPKGKVAKAVGIKNELPELNNHVCKSVVAVCENALAAQYSKRELLGRVYVDEELKNYIVPFSQRSASKSAKTPTRGSVIPMGGDAKTIRGFIWWTNTNQNKKSYDDGRVDIDLSAAIFDEDWNYIQHVSYTCLKSDRFKTYHSGDITNGGDINGNGVAEFIDVDIKSVSDNARYVVFQIYCYTNQKFSELPNLRFGWMERECNQSGETFEPSTVEMSMDVISESTVAIPVIFDCKERKVIWCDMNVGLESARSNYGGNNLESNLSGVKATCYALTHMSKPNIYDLCMLNATSRGIVVENRNDADVIFSNDTTIPVELIETTDENGKKVITERKKENVKIITAFDTDYIMGQLL